MATEFRLPELGENIESGKVTSVMVSVGDTIAQDQPVIEVETDKAALEVPSSVSGTVKEIRVKEGQDVKVGAVVLVVEAGGAASKPAAPAAAKAPEPPAPEATQPEKAAPAPAPAPRAAAPEPAAVEKEAAREAPAETEAAAPEAAEPPETAGRQLGAAAVALLGRETKGQAA